MKVFFDVDGVLIDGWHCKPERRRPWDANIERDLGVNRQAFQQAFFGRPAGASCSVMHACVLGDRDLKDALAAVLPALGYSGTVDAFVAYWFEHDANVNGAVLDVVKRLGQHERVALYIATGQEHHRAAYLWDELGFGAHFQDTFYSARLGCFKGTPVFFEKINAALEISPPERPVFFDDQANVVDLARDAGWDGCVFESIDDLSGHPRLRDLLR